MEVRFLNIKNYYTDENDENDKKEIIKIEKESFDFQTPIKGKQLFLYLIIKPLFWIFWSHVYE